MRRFMDKYFETECIIAVYLFKDCVSIMNEPIQYIKYYDGSRNKTQDENGVAS